MNMRLSLILLLTPDISLMFTSLTFRKCLSASAITNVTCSLHLTQPDPSLDHTMARLGPVGSPSRLSRSCPPCRRTSCLDHISRPAPRPIAGGHHQLVHEVDDGSRRLVQVQLRKNVALKYFDHVFEDEDDDCWCLTLPCKNKKFFETDSFILRKWYSDEGDDCSEVINLVASA